VFPLLNEAEICLATPESVEQWDSLANARLTAVIEEQFAVALELEGNPSFGQILSYLRQRLALA
jgi:precorrin-2 methylase